MVKTSWTPERIREAAEVWRAERSSNAAARVLAQRWGEPVSSCGLREALGRSGINARSLGVVQDRKLAPEPRPAALALYLAELEVRDAQGRADGPGEQRAKSLLKAAEVFAARLLLAGVQVHLKPLP